MILYNVNIQLLVYDYVACLTYTSITVKKENFKDRAANANETRA